VFIGVFVLEVSPLGRVPTGFHSLPVGGVLEAYGRLLEVSWKAIVREGFQTGNFDKIRVFILVCSTLEASEGYFGSLYKIWWW